MRCSPHVLALATVLWLIVGHATAQTTWIVEAGGGPGVHFADIPPAIAAAAPGDRVEVRGTATYSAFVLSKGMDVEATGGAAVPFFHVRGLPASDAARVAGFSSQPRPTFGSSEDRILIDACQGPVLLADLDVWVQTPDPIDGLVVRDSRSVVLADCTSRGRSSGREEGGAGLFLQRSAVAVIRSYLAGGNGGTLVAVGFDGGPGVRIAESELYVALSTVQGGNGGMGGGDGGDGVVITGTGRVTAAAVTAGGGGPGAFGAAFGYAIHGPCRVTTDSQLTGGTAGGVTFIPPLTLLEAPPSVALGSSFALDLTGPAGTVAVLFVDLRHAHSIIYGLREPLLLTAQLVPFAAVPIPPSGTAQHRLGVPDAAALSERDAFFQGGAIEPGRVTLTPIAPVRIR